MVGLIQKIRNGKSKTLILVVGILISIVLLTLSFYKNIFEVAEVTTFRDWQNNSEAFVTGRLIKSRQEGLTADYGLLQKDPDWDKSNKFVTDEHVDHFTVYTSQIGLQAFLFGIIDRVVPLSSSDTLTFLNFINSFLLALLIAFVAFWASKQFGLLSGIFIIIGCVFSPWLVFTAKNLYWVLWTMLLPFVSILYLQWLEQKSVKVHQSIYLLAAFITIFIKAACGFEFITTILISIEIPVIFYAIKEKWDKKRYIYRSALIGIGGLLAFITAFCINMWQRVMYYGDFDKGWNNMVVNISKRTGAFDADVAPIFQNSLTQSVLKVINTYLRDGTPVVLDYRMAELILILIILTLCLLISQKYIPSIEKERSKLVPLAIAAYISLLAPVSWMILAKGHSYIHTTINYILWYFPCVLLIFALCGAVIQFIWSDIWQKQRHNFLKKGGIVISLILIFSWPVCRFYQAWDWQQNTQQVKQAQNDGMSLYKDESIEVLYYDNVLFYKVNKEADVSLELFLHITPVHLDDLPKKRMKYGFENQEFAFMSAKISWPFWGTHYITRIELPDYEIEQISTGQTSGSTVLWEASVNLTE